MTTTRPGTWRDLLLSVVAAMALTACQPATAPSGGLPASDHVHALEVLDGGGLLLGLHGALYRSEDGRNWQVAGLEGQDAMSIGAVGDDAPLFVAGHDLLARSLDGGKTFEPMQPADLPSLDIHAFAQSPADPDVVYAFVVGSGIHTSADGGETWELRAPVGRAVGDDVVALAVLPDDPGTVLVGGVQSGLFRSTDGARTFDRVLPQGVGSLATSTDAPDRVVALTARGIEASADGGRTWTVVVAPTEAGVDGQPVVIATGDGDTAWLVTERPRTLQRSQDGGRSWEEIARAEP
ncbi:MAG: hypothetical protein M3N17_07945 [Actinomycetota bacterium]|nr:hypothetical protein [Actinomycetota bacterium]